MINNYTMLVLNNAPAYDSGRPCYTLSKRTNYNSLLCRPARRPTCSQRDCYEYSGSRAIHEFIYTLSWPCSILRDNAISLSLSLSLSLHTKISTIGSLATQTCKRIRKQLDALYILLAGLRKQTVRGLRTGSYFFAIYRQLESKFTSTCDPSRELSDLQPQCGNFLIPYLYVRKKRDGRLLFFAGILYSEIVIDGAWRPKSTD